MPPNDRPLHPGSACLPCRKRKAKCDGVRPMCARCKRLGSNCQFDPPNRSSLATRTLSSEKKSSPPATDYVLAGIGMTNPVSASYQRLLAKLPDEARLDRIVAAGYDRPSLPIYSYREGWENSFEPGRISRTLYPENFETCIPRASVEAAIHDWDVRYEPPPDVADYLIRLFIPFRRQYFFYMEPRRLVHRASLPQSDPEAIHPALLNAIYLAACQLAKGELLRFQAILLARSRAYMDEALAHVDRLTHFLGASLILSSWYNKSARAVEAQSTIATTVQFAVACGLHDPNDPSTSVMLPPADEIEVSDRRNLWYGIAMADNSLAFAHGLPRVAPEKSISSLDYLVNESLNDMFQYPTAVQIRCRTNELLFATRQFMEEWKLTPHSPALIHRGAILSQILGTFTNSLPPIDSPDGLAPGEAISLANPDMINAHIDIYGVTMQLMNARLQEEPHAYERMYKSACAIASISTHLRRGGRLELIHASPGYLLALHVACEVLLRDLMQNNGDAGLDGERRAAATEHNLELLLTFETDLLVHFPSKRWGIRKIRGILAGFDKFETI